MEDPCNFSVFFFFFTKTSSTKQNTSNGGNFRLLSCCFFFFIETKTKQNTYNGGNFSNLHVFAQRMVVFTLFGPTLKAHRRHMKLLKKIKASVSSISFQYNAKCLKDRRPRHRSSCRYNFKNFGCWLESFMVTLPFNASFCSKFS